MRRSVFLRILLESAWTLAAAIVLGALVGLVYSLAQTPSYSATSRVYVSVEATEETLQAASFLSDRRARSYRSLLTSPALLERSISVNGLPTTANYLESHLTVTSPAETSLIDITVSAETGELAARYADAIGREFVAATSELESQGVIGVKYVNDALVPGDPTHPRTFLNIFNSAWAFAVVTLTFSYYRAFRNPKLSYLGEVTTIAGIPVVANLEVNKRTYSSGRRSMDRHSTPMSNELSSMAGRLFAAEEPERGTIVQVTSTDERMSMLVGDVLRRQLANRVAVAAGPSPPGSTLAAHPDVIVGVMSIGAHWRDAVRLANQMSSSAPRCVLVIVRSGKT